MCVCVCVCVRLCASVCVCVRVGVHECVKGGLGGETLRVSAPVCCLLLSDVCLAACAFFCLTSIHLLLRLSVAVFCTAHNYLCVRHRPLRCWQ